MKEKQRWQPEEDALLCDHVKEHGTDGWNSIAEKLDRDPKSCHERWKNYLKPGIKRGPLTGEEQQLVIRLQQKYGNKWKRIAAEVPGRTAKRLGKWWEVYKERMQKELKQRQGAAQIQLNRELPVSFSSCLTNVPSLSTSSDEGSDVNLPSNNNNCISARQLNTYPSFVEPILTLGRAPTSPNAADHGFMDTTKQTGFSLDLYSLDSADDSGDTSFRGSPLGEAANKADEYSNESTMASNLVPLFGIVKDLEENRRTWDAQKQKMTLRLRELKRKLETERMEKRKQKMEEVELKIDVLRKEEKLYLDKLETDYAELASNLERDAELKEAKLAETWNLKYEKLICAFEFAMNSHGSMHGPLFQAIQTRGLENST